MHPCIECGDQAGVAVGNLVNGFRLDNQAFRVRKSTSFIDRARGKESPGFLPETVEPKT